MISVLVGASSISILFASISIVSGVTLAILVFNDSRQANNNNSMVSFNRHLDALSDDSRAPTSAQRARTPKQEVNADGP